MDFQYAATHCVGCSAEVPKVVYPDGGIVLGPRCPTCEAKDRAWLETHCGHCQAALPTPRPLLDDVAENLCACCEAYLIDTGDYPPTGITDADIPF